VAPLKKTDRELGMHRRITRRDFIHDVSLATAMLGLPLGSIAAGRNESISRNYPPTRTGIRGSHPGAFESAHALARAGKGFAAPHELDEEYDLVVVGAGISGLAAAQYYRKRFGKDARILLLDNHDDFGGHAKRNEFHQGGQMRLALGGTHNLEHWQFSDIVNAMMEELGVDVEDLRKNREFDYGRNGKNGPAIWFDEETYGKNTLLTNFQFGRGNPGDLAGIIDQFPISESARRELRNFSGMRENILAGKSESEVQDYLRSTSYYDFLRSHGGLNEEALQLFDTECHGSWGVETRSLSVAECLDVGMPGLHLIGEETDAEDWDYPVAMFPDGNASIARLQVRDLIPSVAPGSNATNIALARFDYSELDRRESAVRLRLNSTAVKVTNQGPGVAVTYLNEGEVYRLDARHCVLACYHTIVPYLCPEMPDEQKAAQKYQVKLPLLLTNVLIRSSAAMDKLGIAGARCPGRMHGDIFMFKGINTGGYRHEFADAGPVPLTFWGSISPPGDVVHVKDQLRSSQEKMLALSFEDYEREVRTVLDGLLGPAGFDVQEDILAITVNRWPHGYSYEYLDLWDPKWPEGEAPHEIARKPFGNIAVANSDAGASAYTHVAIDEAYRAVKELPA